MTLLYCTFYNCLNKIQPHLHDLFRQNIQITVGPRPADRPPPRGSGHHEGEDGEEAQWKQEHRGWTGGNVKQ